MPSGQSRVYRVRNCDGVHYPRVRRHRGSKSQGSSKRVLPWQVTMDQMRLYFPHPLIVWSGYVELKVPMVPCNLMNYVCMYVCVVITCSRLWVNRVRLPILLVLSWTGKMNIPLYGDTTSQSLNYQCQSRSWSEAMHVYSGHYLHQSGWLPTVLVIGWAGQKRKILCPRWRLRNWFWMSLFSQVYIVEDRRAKSTYFQYAIIWLLI